MGRVERRGSKIVLVRGCRVGGMRLLGWEISGRIGSFFWDMSVLFLGILGRRRWVDGFRFLFLESFLLIISIYMVRGNSGM